MLTDAHQALLAEFETRHHRAGPRFPKRWHDAVFQVNELENQKGIQARDKIAYHDLIAWLSEKHPECFAAVGSGLQAALNCYANRRS